jgi:predicted ATPase
MRIAFSGAHRTGKSTLLEAVAERLPGHRTVDEPYWLLEEEGYQASDPPSAADYVAQLRRSIALLAEAGRDVLFDRCPADIIAYLRATDSEDEADEWLDAARAAMASLDLVVLVPIEAPDRIAVAASEDRRLRRDVDEVLQALLLDDGLGAAVTVVDVRGDVDRRARQALASARPR